MKTFACVLMLLGVTVCLADDTPTPDKPKGKGNKEVQVSLANTAKTVADQLKVGTVIDIVIEEPGASLTHTVFTSKRVHATADDKRKKDGHTVSVNLSEAQAAAYEILKEAGTVSVELHKSGGRTSR